MHPGSTHIALLTACVARSRGPVIELGCGDYSTRLLHLLCKGRILVSLDNDRAWVDRFQSLRSTSHILDHVPDWGQLAVAPSMFGFPQGATWSVAFVDGAPAETRVPLIERLIPYADQIVIHDTEHPLYGYERVWDKFKYHYNDIPVDAAGNAIGPWTSVVSNSVEFIP